MYVTGIPEGEEKGTKEIFEVIMAENFPKAMTNSKAQIQGAQRTQSKISMRKPTPRHIIFKLQKIKDKENILKDAREFMS